MPCCRPDGRDSGGSRLSARQSSIKVRMRTSQGGQLCNWGENQNGQESRLHGLGLYKVSRQPPSVKPESVPAPAPQAPHRTALRPPHLDAMSKHGLDTLTSDSVGGYGWPILRRIRR